LLISQESYFCGGFRSVPTGRRVFCSTLTQDCAALVLGYFRFLPPGEWTLAVLRLSWAIFAFSLRANGHWLFCACPRLFSLSPSGRMDIGCFALVLGYFRFLPPGEWTLAVLRLSPVIFAFSLRENGHWLFCACPGLFSLSPSGRMDIGCFALVLGYFRFLPPGEWALAVSSLVGRRSR